MYKDVVIYGSMGGTTKETAEKMKMAAQNKVDVFNSKNKPAIDLNQYDRVFIGSGIYAKQFTKEIQEFLQKNRSVLNSKNVIFFVHGLSPEAEGKEIVRNVASSYFSSNNYTVFYLGGKLDLKHKNLFVRMFNKFIANKAKLDPQNPSNINEQRVSELLKCISSTK